MTSSNINKIMRTNISLKPWILSKNTTEIVNTCIKKIYKQSQSNFKYELVHSKPTVTRAENKGPIRSFRSQERIRQPAVINNQVTRKKGRLAPAIGRERLINAAVNNAKRPTVAAVANVNKRLLRSPTYKIYGSRRFGSSASSSTGSMFRRHDERRRQRNHSSLQLNYLLRSFGTQPGSKINFGLNAAVAKYLVPVRNQHIESRLGSVPRAIQVSSAIQRDLMSIDNKVKDRISLGRHKLTKLAPNKPDADPMEGWHHPPQPELFMTRLNERSMANGELYEQYNRLKSASKQRQFEHLRLMEKKAHLVSGSVGKKQVNRQRISETFLNTAREAVRAEKASIGQRLDAERIRRLSGRHRPQSTSTAMPTATAAAVIGSPANTIQTILPTACAAASNSSVTNHSPTKPPTTAQTMASSQSLPTTKTVVESPRKVPIRKSEVKPAVPTATTALGTATSAVANTAVVRGLSVNSTSRFNRSSYLPNKKF